jgi:hypothetical protein
LLASFFSKAENLTAICRLAHSQASATCLGR